MKALYISNHNPFGTAGGGEMASHAYLRAFADVFQGNIDLVVADTANGKDYNIILSEVYPVPSRSKVSKLLSVFTGQMHRYTDFVKKLLRENSDKYTHIVFDHSCIGGTLIKEVKKFGLKTITIHHNYEKEYYNDNSSFRNKVLFLHHVVRNERRAYKLSDLNIFLTGQDLKTFECVYGMPKGVNYVLGTFEYQNYIQQAVSGRENPLLTFSITGSLCTHQGMDGLRYFFSELYPYLPKNCKVIVSGRNPTQELKCLCDSHGNIELIPNPPNMSDVINQADVYICPTRIGGGLKLRVMDGLKLGLPVISHVCSSRGYDAFFDTGCFEIFSTPSEFEKSLESIIGKIENRKLSKANVQKIYKEVFSYDAGYQRLSMIMRKVFNFDEKVRQPNT